MLVAAGALTKSAQFPFHFWLPHAMAAPTPVSAYLHSAAMVKLGVFLLARLWPVLAGTDAWMWIVGIAGLVTLVLGAYIAIFQHDLKGLLAYSTISHLGLITVLLGLNSPLAAVAAIFHIMNHATFKASLFMAAGIIDHETGTRDIRRLSGLYRFMPITATLAMVAAAAMAGVPLLNGFLSKEMFFAEALRVEGPVPRHRPRAAVHRHAVGHVQRRLFAALHPRRVLRPAAGGPAARRRTSRRAGCAFRSSCWCSPAWLVGILPALTIGPFLDIGVRALLGAQRAALQPGGLARLHHAAPHELGRARRRRRCSTCCCRSTLRAARSARRSCRRSTAGASSTALLVALSWRWARALESAARHAAPAAAAALAACSPRSLPALWPVWERGLDFGPLPLSRRSIRRSP